MTRMGLTWTEPFAMCFTRLSAYNKASQYGDLVRFRRIRMQEITQALREPEGQDPVLIPRRSLKCCSELWAGQKVPLNLRPYLSFFLFSFFFFFKSLSLSLLHVCGSPAVVHVFPSLCSSSYVWVACHGECIDQKTICGSYFSPSTTWVLELEAGL